MGCSTLILTLLLNLFNAFFLIGGVGLFGVGIWSVVDKIYVSGIIGNELFSAASIIAIVAAIIVIVVSIMGLVAVIRRMRRLLLLYFGIELLLFILLITVAAIAVAFRGELESQMINAMKNTLTYRYGKNVNSDTENRRVTEAWDRLQRENQCCAVDDRGWAIYRSTAWFTDQYEVVEARKMVPESCCVIDEHYGRYEPQVVAKCQSFDGGPPNNPEGPFANNAVLHDGCYLKAKAVVLNHSGIFVALGFMYAALQVAGLTLTFLVYLRFTHERKYPQESKDTELGGYEDEEVPPYEEKPSLEGSPRLQGRRRYSDRERQEDRERHNSRDSYEDRSSYHDRDSHSDRERYSERDRYSDRDRHSERDRPSERDRYSDRDRPSERDRYSDRDRHSERDRYSDRDRNEDRDRYEDRPRQEERPRRQGRERPTPKERHMRPSLEGSV